MKSITAQRGLTALVGLILPASLAFAPADYPRDWGGGGQGYKLTLDSTTKHGGKSSGTIRSTEDDVVFGTFTQWFRADQYRGKRLRLTGYIKTQGVEANRGAGLWMRIDGKEQTSLAFDNMNGRRPDGTTDWKSYDVVLDIPDNAEEIYFGCLLAGPGQAWVDDLKFEVVGKDVASTKLDTPANDRPKGNPLIEMGNNPKNLDFES